jgi:MFS family permease
MWRRSVLAGALTGAIFGLLAAILIFATHSFLFGIGWDTAGYGILNILLFTAGGAVFGVAFAIVSQWVGKAIAALALTAAFWGLGGFSVGSLPATAIFTGVFLAIVGLEGRRELGAIPLAALLVAPPLVSFVSPVGVVAPYASSLTEGALENAALSLLPQTAPVVWSLPHHSWRIEVYVKDAQGNPIPEAMVLIGPPPEYGGYVSFYGESCRYTDNQGRAYFDIPETPGTFVLYAFAKGYTFENRLVQIAEPQTFTVVLENIVVLKTPLGATGQWVFTSYYMRKPYYTFSGGLDGWHSTTHGGWGCVLNLTRYGRAYGGTTVSAWGGFEGSRLQGWYEDPYYKQGYNFVSTSSVSVSGTTASVSSHTDMIDIDTYGGYYYPIPEGGQPTSGELRRYISSDMSQQVQFARNENGDLTWSGEGSGQVSVYGNIVPMSLKHSGVLRMLGRDVEAVLDGTVYYQGEPNPPSTYPGDPIWGLHLDLTLKDIGPGIRGAVQYTVVEQYFPTQVTTIEKKAPTPTLAAAPTPAVPAVLPVAVTFSLASMIISLLALALAVRR